MSPSTNKLGNIVKDEDVIKRLKEDIDDLIEPQINALLDVMFIKPRDIRQMRELSISLNIPRKVEKSSQLCILKHN
jgi:hypothetical protein